MYRRIKETYYFKVVIKCFKIGFSGFRPICYCCLLFSHSVMSDPFLIPWTITHQAPLSMGFPRQKCWSGLPHLLLQEIVLTQGSNFCLLHWLVDSLPLTYTHRTWEKRGVRGRILVTKFFIEVCNSFYMIQFLIWKKILTVIRTYTIK